PAPRARDAGEARVTRLGRRGEFFGLREFRDGDDRSSIHWRSTARAGQLMVREYEQEAQRRVTLMVDNALPEGADGKLQDALEDAVSLAASLATAYIGAGYSVRLVCRGTQLPFAAGEPQLLRILRALALLETVAPDRGFSARLQPRSESVLV